MFNNGWLQEPKTQNTKRFHKDKKSRVDYPKVFVDSGRPLSNKPALIKGRIYVDHKEAEDLWSKLQRQGWRKVRPQWGKSLDV